MKCNYVTNQYVTKEQYLLISLWTTVADVCIMILTVKMTKKNNQMQQMLKTNKISIKGNV